ncbi:MAG: filamentous hemagglutinin N-terminal domain-containing protein [Oscillatoriophycideae cyanobacterium NC_groundwater_1537_Pr4_S-0.65um_50_18]|nr:filamentous hemagglutinin N-terminal domain-containing protein [Oscillatoriophycideae cyanobacterium NC_groundwater_1537_Pr4_S-0.65um_50_18]
MKVVPEYRWIHTHAIALIAAAINAVVVVSGTAVMAQVTPDRTLGSEQSTVNRNVMINGRNSDRIEGGARRGTNLFHSFEQFNVGNGQRLYFANPTGVLNIIGRVTGRGASNISGTLGVQGNANLFLMNPNGIIFGNNATLDLRGSFVGTTANRLQFGTQGFFGTNDPQAPPLLTINPSALLFSQARPGKIQTQSVADAGASLAGNPLLGLRVADGQNLLLIGGEVAIAGGLHALGGQLGVIAAAAPATVELTANQRPTLQRFPSPTARGNVLIRPNAFLNVAAASDGNIQIAAKNIAIQSGSLLLAGIDESLGNRDSQAGDITLNATRNIEISGGAVQNLLSGRGTGGDVAIRARSLTLNEGGSLAASTLSQGNAGRVTIQVTDAVILTEGAFISNTIEPDAVGSTGGIFLEADSLVMTGGAQLAANTSGIGNSGNVVVRVRGDARLTGDSPDSQSGIFNVVSSGAVGNAGEIRLNAGSLSLTNGAGLQAYTSAQGNGGAVKIRVHNRLRLDGTSSDGLVSSISTIVLPGAVGNGGSIDIQAGSLTISGGAQLIADTLGRGNAGNITVQVDDRLFIDGSVTDFNDPLSGIFTTVDPEGVGNSGSIDIQAGSLTLLNGAQLLAATFGRGNAGDITVRVRDRATFDDFTDAPIPSGVFSIVGGSRSTVAAFGNGGDINISANQIELRNGAALGASVESDGQGNAGRITIKAIDYIFIEGTIRSGEPIGGVFTRTALGAVGNANDIRITTDRLTVSNDAVIQASVGSNGKAGDIQINSRIVDLLNGGELQTTTASRSRAGDIDLLVGDRITLSGQNSGLFASTERNATGQGGSINITTRQLAVSDRAEVTVSSPTGRAGNLTIAANQISLDRGSLTATAGAGSGARITLQEVDSLLLQNNSLISAQASNRAIGGNVTVNAPNGFVAAVPEQNNDIIAIADEGRGGNISITAQGIFSIQPQRSTPQNQTNDIDARSRFNQSGTVTINQPDVDPSRGVIELPTDVVDRATQIARGCTPGSNESSRFISTGRGGLPLSPDQPLRDRAIVSPGWLALDSERGDRQTTQPQSQDERRVEQAGSSENAFIEANELSRDASGKVVLVAQTQTEEAVIGRRSDRVCLEQFP